MWQNAFLVLQSLIIILLISPSSPHHTPAFGCAKERTDHMDNGQCK